VGTASVVDGGESPAGAPLVAGALLALLVPGSVFAGG